MSVGDETKKVATFGLLVIILVFCYPLFVVSGIALWRQHNTIVFRKRRMRLITLQFIIIAVSLLILLPLFLMADMSDYSSNIDKPLFPNMRILQWNAALSFIQSFDICLLVILWFIFFIRAYLLWFNHEYSHAIIATQWCAQIDLNFENTNFWIRKRPQLGNDLWWIKILIFVSLIIISLLFIFQELIFNGESNPGFLLLLITFIIAIVGTIIVWRRFPARMDTWKIRLELQSLAIFNIVVSVCGGLTFLVGYLSHVDINFIGPYWQVSMLCGDLYIVVIWVIKHNSEIINSANPRELTQISTALFNISSNGGSFRRSNTGNFTSAGGNGGVSSQVKMKQVLEDWAFFEGFIHFLCTEFSSENLLFLIEYIQFKNSLKLPHQTIRTLRLNKVEFRVPIDKLPKSPFVVGMDVDIPELIATCKAFYYKYLAPNQAPLEVNIASATRNKCYVLLDDRFDRYQRLHAENAKKKNAMKTSDVEDTDATDDANNAGLGKVMSELLYRVALLEELEASNDSSPDPQPTAIHTVATHSNIFDSSLRITHSLHDDAAILEHDEIEMEEIVVATATPAMAVVIPFPETVGEEQTRHHSSESTVTDLPVIRPPPQRSLIPPIPLNRIASDSPTGPRTLSSAQSVSLTGGDGNANEDDVAVPTSPTTSAYDDCGVAPLNPNLIHRGSVLLASAISNLSIEMGSASPVPNANDADPTLATIPSKSNHKTKAIMVPSPRGSGTISPSPPMAGLVNRHSSGAILCSGTVPSAVSGTSSLPKTCPAMSEQPSVKKIGSMSKIIKVVEMIVPNFETAAEEIVSLLRDSFSRFTKTDEYSQLSIAYHSKMEKLRRESERRQSRSRLSIFQLARGSSHYNTPISPV